MRPNDRGKLTTQIYVSKAGLILGKAERVPLFESDSIAVGHPAISPDENTLYFVTNMPGGQGGKDIWYSTFEGGQWSRPKNLGPEINTPVTKFSICTRRWYSIFQFRWTFRHGRVRYF